MFLKIFLGIIVVLALLACIGANEKRNKRMGATVAIVTLVLLTVATLNDTGKEEKEVTAVAPERGTLEVEQNAWGTITVTDDTGKTTEYQGCINISGEYKYKTGRYMGLSVKMEDASKVGEWSPGSYEYSREREEEYWEEKEEREKE